jgi:hypothetical protein
VGGSRPLDFDPIEEARRQWIDHEWVEAADGMALVTSVMRVQQIYLTRISAELRGFGLTFARCSFTSASDERDEHGGPP